MRFSPFYFVFISAQTGQNTFFILILEYCYFTICTFLKKKIKKLSVLSKKCHEQKLFFSIFYSLY